MVLVKMVLLKVFVFGYLLIKTGMFINVGLFHGPGFYYHKQY